MRAERALFIMTAGAALLVLASPAPAQQKAGKDKAARTVETASTASADTSMVLKGSEEGTVFKSLTIEGEDRVRIEFERPALKLNLDPLSAPGLDWKNTREILAQCGVDYLSPLVGLSARERSPYLSRPWLDMFAAGDIVRFRPALTDVERWRMTIADSRSKTVAVFEGKGKPPEQLGWSGRASDGSPMPPGLTYSYVLEAYDRAGTKRNFVGKGFELPPYRFTTPKELVLMFSGTSLGFPATGRPDDAPPALLLDAAARLNQIERADGAVRIAVTARTFQQADNLSKRIGASLAPLLLGNPTRIQCVAETQPDAPAGGTVAIRATL